MLRIKSVKIAGLSEGCITDEAPDISFMLESDVPGETLKGAVISCGDWRVETTDQVNNLYGGELFPFTRYEIKVMAAGTSGEVARATAAFETGRMDTPWQAQWITDLNYDFPKKKSPVPMTFRRNFTLGKSNPLRRAWVNATALGVYELSINGQKIGQDYFAPGLTSCEHHMQYQSYDITDQLAASNTLLAEVAGGWAAGSFNYNRKSKIYADRQAFLCELFLEYEDGSRERICTDSSWNVTTEGRYKMAEWYDGETFDATVDLSADTIPWKPADVTRPRKRPQLLAQYGTPVRAQGVMKPVSSSVSPSGEIVYDFGQNFAGVVSAVIKNAKKGHRIIFRHAEVLVDGELFVKSLRTAKATATYICKEGEQEYSPRLTYMGFRYVGVSGISQGDIELSALVLHSCVEEIGSFSCSNDLLNRLNENIRWGGKSNFMDIPTDCPQRDERQGWTGDIAVFASTACFNFDMSRFFDKWLRDVRVEQGKGGGIPMVVPRAGDKWPVMATACWGDACVLVPWAEYMARGNKRLLEKQYPTIKRFLKAAKWWSAFLSFTPSGRYIWRFPFQYGDWCAPGETVTQWMMKGKWVGTAYFANSCSIMAQIADVLGKPEDSRYYIGLRENIVRAYRKVFTDGKGKLKKEFQTAYVLPLAFGMTEGEETKAMADNLARLVQEADNHLSTGFTGTPYLLFALSDNGHEAKAFEVLLQEGCPGWLYEVKAGGTTIWERWDGMRPDGSVNIGDLQGKKSDEESDGGMVSFNHYANGAVGDWLYRRAAGLEAVEAGYKRFRVKPILGGDLQWVSCKTETPFGQIHVSWKITGDTFELYIQVPVGTVCEAVLPDGTGAELSSGNNLLTCTLK